MCHLITVVIPSGHHSQLQGELPGDVELHPLRNPHITKFMPSGFDAYMLTTGDADLRCSCSLYTPLEASSEKEFDPVEQLRRKYRQRGWSATKIERAIASARYQHEQERAYEFIGLRPDVLAALGQALPNLRKLFVWVHEYHGDYDRESISITTRRVSKHEFGKDNFQLAEDTLLEIVA